MHRAFLDRHFPVRWTGNQNFGYGYPLFLFTYPLPYYFGEVFKLIGFNLVSSVKILFILSVILSGMGMFFLGRELFGNGGGLISTVFYLFAPYRLVNLYVRGSLGESLSLIFFPILFLMAIKIAKEKKEIYAAFFSLFFAGLLLTHNVSSLIFTPFLLLLCTLLYFKTPLKEKLIVGKALIFSLLMGFSLAAFFLLPAILEKNYLVLTSVRIADLQKNFISFPELILPRWGYGPYGGQDGFSVQLGWVHFLALVTAFFVFLKSRKKELGITVLLVSFISLIILIFLSLPISLPFWEKIPLFSNVDFPWRVLGPGIFFLSLCLGYLGSSRPTIIFGTLLAIMAIIINLPYAQPKETTNLPESYYFTNEATTTSADELMPLWVIEKPRARYQEKIEILDGVIKINQLESNTIKTTFRVEAETEARLRLNTIFFPGWKAFVDSLETTIDFQNNKGVMEINIPKGNHSVMFLFGETTLRLFSDYISLISLMIVTFFLIRFFNFKIKTR